MKLYDTPVGPSLKENGIEYIREEIPEFSLPEYRGASYEDLIPDTLDLQDRASLAINGITGPTDVEKDYEIYWIVSLYRNPPSMTHRIHDHVQFKFFEGAPLLRTMTGSAHNHHVDRRWYEPLLHMQGRDGSFYWTKDKRPWSHMPFFDIETESKHYAIPVMEGPQIGAAALLYKLTDDPVWRECAERAAAGIMDRCLPCDDHMYLPDIIHAPDTPVDPQAPKVTYNGEMACNEGWYGQALLQVFNSTGNERALDVGGRLIKGSAFNSVAFDPETADFTGSKHFHSHTRVLLALAEYAQITGDRQSWEFVEKAYECGKEYGQSLIGYFPEFIKEKHRSTCELCEVAEMIALAVKMSQSGHADCWDDADRWVRNHFAEGQLTDTSWIHRMVNRSPAMMPTEPIDPVAQSVDQVPERNLGAFGGWLTGNEWGRNIMHCCTGNAIRTLYYVWEGVIDCENGELRVNLLLNRASPWADVDSHIPYTGQVDIKVKQALEKVWIRIPEWVAPEETVCRVEGGPKRLDWRGKYCSAGSARPGETISVSFPIETRDERVWVEKEALTYTFKGNDVIGVDPPGVSGPLYRREHYRQDVTRWKRVTRFVPEKDIRW